MVGNQRKRKISVVDHDSDFEEAAACDTTVENGHPKLKSRLMPRVLVEACQKLNQSQKQAILEMGFGSVLKLEVKEFPQQLTYWLVDSFNLVSSELMIRRGRSIHVDGKDVQRVMGFPKGAENIEKKTMSEECKLLEKWLDLFGKENNKITAADVCEKMLACSDGDEWFKRHFLVLVDCLLNGNTQSGARWEIGNKTQFNGPLIFLAGLYVDRVVVYTRDVPRSIPSIVGLTYDILKKRTTNELKLGGFGRGYVDKPLQIEEVIEPNVVDASSSLKVDVQAPQEYAKKVISKLSCLANDVVDIISLLKDAPKEVTEDAHFARIHEVANRLICSTKAPSEMIPLHAPPDISGTQQVDAFWNDPDTIAAIERVEDALGKREEYQNYVDDVPSFSLGFTQEEGNVRGGPVLDNVREVAVSTPFIDKAQCEQQIHTRAKIKFVMDKRISDEDVHVAAASSPPREQPSRKAKRAIGKAPSLVSPFTERMLNAVTKCDIQQGIVAHWIFNNDEADSNEIVFQFQQNALLRDGLRTLERRSLVNVAVVDTWAKILNQKEVYRSKSSPMRYFSTTYPCQYTVVSRNEDWDCKMKLQTFTNSFDEELKDGIGVKLEDVDMFLFPLFQSEHYIVMCIDIKRRQYHILDNSEVGGTDLSKYDQLPYKLRHMFSQYLRSKGHDRLAEKILKMEPVRLSLPWSDSSNKVDCAIFAMRHMETYMGGGVRGWKSGLEWGTSCKCYVCVPNTVLQLPSTRSMS